MSIRTYAPVYGEEATSVSGIVLYYPVDVYMPCSPKSTKLFSLLIGDAIMAVVSVMCVLLAVLLSSLAIRSLWHTKTVRDKAIKKVPTPVPSPHDTSSNSSDDSSPDTSSEDEAQAEEDEEDEEDDEEAEESGGDGDSVAESTRDELEESGS